MKKLKKLFELNSILLLLFQFLIIFPIVIILIYAFTIKYTYPDILPNKFTLIGIKTLFSTYNLNYLYSGLIIAVLSSFITNLVVLPPAYIFARYDFQFKNLIFILFFIPILIPVTSYGMGLQFLFAKLALTDNYFGVIISHIIITMPYVLVALTHPLKMVDVNIEYSARVLGASKLMVFKEILLPLIFPALVSSFSLGIVISFGEYFLTLIIGGGRVKTFAMVFVPYLQSDLRYLSSSFAVFFIAVLFMLFIILKLFLRKHYIKLGLGEKNGLS